MTNTAQPAKTKKSWTTPKIEDVALGAADVASTIGTSTPDFITTAS